MKISDEAAPAMTLVHFKFPGLPFTDQQNKIVGQATVKLNALLGIFRKTFGRLLTGSILAVKNFHLE